MAAVEDFSSLSDLADELGIPEDDLILTILRKGRVAFVLFLLGLAVFLILAARLVNYALIYGTTGSSRKRKKRGSAYYSSSSLPVSQYGFIDESTTLGKKGSRVGRKGTPQVISSSSSSSTDAIKLGLGMVHAYGLPARTGSSMVIHDETGTVYIYGGEGQAGISEDLLVFNQKEGDWSWTRPHGYHVPGPLGYACLGVTSSYLFLYGGAGPCDFVNSEIVVMDLESGEWYAAIIEGGEEKERPEGRFAASLERWRDHGWVLFGGIGESGAHLNDMWLLKEVPGRQRGEIPAFTWERLMVEGSEGDAMPSTRKCHSAIITAADEMLILGGFAEQVDGAVEGACVDVIDLNKRQWRKERVKGVGPSGGPGGKAFRVGPEGRRIVFIGPASVGVFNEVLVLDTSGGSGAFQWLAAEWGWEGDWTMVPGGRTHFCAASDPGSDEVFVYGGDDHTGKAQSQLLVLHTSDALVNTTRAEDDISRGEEKLGRD